METIETIIADIMAKLQMVLDAVSSGNQEEASNGAEMMSRSIDQLGPAIAAVKEKLSKQEEEPDKEKEPKMKQADDQDPTPPGAPSDQQEPEAGKETETTLNDMLKSMNSIKSALGTITKSAPSQPARKSTGLEDRVELIEKGLNSLLSGFDNVLGAPQVQPVQQQVTKGLNAQGDQSELIAMIAAQVVKEMGDQAPQTSGFGRPPIRNVSKSLQKFAGQGG